MTFETALNASQHRQAVKSIKTAKQKRSNHPMKYTLVFLLLLAIGGPVAQASSAPNPFESTSIYEVNLRQFTEAGDLTAFEKHLPRLQELGVDVLWFMPVQPIGVLKRKGTLGSPYSVSDYRAFNPEFGTIEQFAALVDRCHEMGFSVLIDWVANHCAWDNALLEQHPDWFTRDEKGAMKPPVDDWSDVVEFDDHNKDFWDYMSRSLVYWIEHTGVDGFRCDVAGMMPMEFWDYARTIIDPASQKVHERPAFMLAEWEGAHVHGPFDASYSWDVYRAFNGLVDGTRDVAYLDELLDKEAAEYPLGTKRMRFTTNHDENTWNGTVAERLGDSADLFTVLSFTLPGWPLVYNGQETGLDHRLEFFEKDLIPWQDHPRQSLFQTLLALRKQSPALQVASTVGLGYRRIKQSGTFAFMREGGGETLLVVAALPGLDGRFDFPQDASAEHWLRLNGEAPQGPSLQLPALGWEIFRLQRP
jgi:cyclomaltodextrinase / maltogenic alpha-amylase / neopullulanase